MATVTSAGTYGDVLKQAVFALKYHRRQAIAPTLAEVLLPAARPLMRTGDVFVPVPLHPSRERERGYNQAALLARALAAALLLDGAGAFAVRDDLLLRVRATADQTRLGPEERRRNMAGAFALAPARDAYPPAGRLWLVDDVVTTGATLDACAGALRALDLPVHGLALARAPGGPGRRARPTGRA
ncbi:MAG: hypothetical protein NVSMB65_03170 [Chloroflexota bacterium]